MVFDSCLDSGMVQKDPDRIGICERPLPITGLTAAAALTRPEPAYRQAGGRTGRIQNSERKSLHFAEFSNFAVDVLMIYHIIPRFLQFNDLK